MSRAKKVILWGIGAAYNKMKNIFSYHELTGQLEIVGITANFMPAGKRLDGIALYRPAEIGKLEYDYIAILADDSFGEIVSEATAMGIERNRLLHYKIFQIPGLVFEEYLKLKESRLTILSNNCWGGMVCHTLGLECCSPTKNLFIKDEDYLKFLSGLKRYMMKTPEYARRETDVHSNAEYPVLVLGDIELHCNHSADVGQAVRDWNRRGAKINYDNLLFEMYTEDVNVALRFAHLESNCRKVCFVPWEMDGECFVHLRREACGQEFWEVVNRSASPEGTQYHLMEILSGNCKNCRLRP